MKPVSLESPLATDNSREASPTKSLIALTQIAGATAVSADFESIALSDNPKTSLPSRQTTSFEQDVVEHLERTNPGVLAWLRSTPGVIFQMLLVISYVLFETIAGLLKSFILKPEPGQASPLPSSLIAMNSGSSIIIGYLISVGTAYFSDRTSRWPLLRSVSNTFAGAFQWRNILSYSFVAFLFSVAGVFSMLAYTKLDAGLKKVLDQLRLPITAALSFVVLGKRYSIYEWVALMILLLGVCNFYFANTARDEISDLHWLCHYPPQCFHEQLYDVCGVRVDGPKIVGVAITNRHRPKSLHDITTLSVQADKTNWLGLGFNLLSTFLNSLASLVFERVVKSSPTPFPMQKTQIELTGFPVAMAMSFIVPLWIDSKGGKSVWWMKNEAEGSGAGFFQGFSESTLIMIAMDVLLAWMSGIIVKQFNSVVRLIAKCVILLLTVLSTGTFLKSCHEAPLSVTMYALSMVTACATVLFATMPSKPAVQQ